MRRHGGEPALGVVIRSRPGRHLDLRDTLYSVASQPQDSAHAIVVIDSDDPRHIEAVAAAVDRVEGLVSTEVTVAGDRTLTAARAFNTGLAAIRQRFCCFLSEGEILYPRYGHFLIDGLEANSTVIAAHGGGRRVCGIDRGDGFVASARTEWAADPLARLRLVREPCIALCATVVRTGHLEQSGVAFDEHLDDLVEWAFLRNLALDGALIAVNAVVCEHRLTSGEAESWPHQPGVSRLRAYASVIASQQHHRVSIASAEMVELASRHDEMLAREQVHRARVEAVMEQVSQHADWLERRNEELERRLAAHDHRWTWLQRVVRTLRRNR